MLLTLLALLAVQSFSHEDWTEVVDRYVDEQGLVDYTGLGGDRAALDRYVAAVGSVSPESNPDLFPTRQHELAYYINAYNALVFAGVLARGPEEDSVWKGGLVSGYGFFVGMKIVVGGRRTSLRSLENDVIRKRYDDPRIHAALNCASMGCPRLPRTPFTGEGLDRQLDEAMREFVNDRRHVRVDTAARKVYLSKIFDWFASDFTAGGDTLIGYINRYRASGKLPAGASIQFLDYDKRINKQGQPW